MAERVVDERYDNPYKVIVHVNADFDNKGNVIPLSFRWEDGTRYEIDRVLDQRRAASLKAGGAGERYTILVQGHEKYLFRDDDVWFVERKTVDGQVLDVHGRPIAYSQRT